MPSAGPRHATSAGDLSGRGVGRSHEFLPHTADAGFSVVAQDLAGLLEESAEALAELSSDPSGGPLDGIPLRETVSLEAPDLESLVVDWLNELIGLGEVHRAAVVRADVMAAAAGPPAQLQATVRLVPYASGRARARLAIKSATYHRLSVGRRRGRWRLTAYVDV